MFILFLDIETYDCDGDKADNKLKGVKTTCTNFEI